MTTPGSASRMHEGLLCLCHKRAVEATDGLNAVEVTAPIISKQLEQMKRKEYGLKTVKTQRTVYSLIFQYAINDDVYGKFVTSNPARNVILLKHLKSEKREAPEDDIINKIRSNATTAYWGLFAMFLISTGCRRGEALALTWGDVDFKGKTISISKAVKYSGGYAKMGDTKTAYGVRVVPLLPDLEKLLVMPEDAKNTDYIFGSTSGSFIVESTYRRRWKHYCTDMGFIICVLEEKRKSKQGKEYIYRKYKNSLTAHVLRHGYATMLFEADVDVYTAQKLLGHADIKTTMAIYTHLRERKQKESLDKLTAYVNNNYAV